MTFLDSNWYIHFNMFTYLSLLTPFSTVCISTFFSGNICFPQGSNSYLVAATFSYYPCQDVTFCNMGEYCHIKNPYSLYPFDLIPHPLSYSILYFIPFDPAALGFNSVHTFPLLPVNIVSNCLSNIRDTAFLWPSDVIYWPYILSWRPGIEVRVYPQRGITIKGRSFWIFTFRQDGHDNS